MTHTAVRKPTLCTQDALYDTRAPARSGGSARLGIYFRLRRPSDARSAQRGANASPAARAPQAFERAGAAACHRLPPADRPAAFEASERYTRSAERGRYLRSTPSSRDGVECVLCVPRGRARAIGRVQRVACAPVRRAPPARGWPLAAGGGGGGGGGGSKGSEGSGGGEGGGGGKGGGGGEGCEGEGGGGSGEGGGCRRAMAQAWVQRGDAPAAGGESGEGVGAGSPGDARAGCAQAWAVQVCRNVLCGQV